MPVGSYIKRLSFGLESSLHEAACPNARDTLSPVCRRKVGVKSLSARGALLRRESMSKRGAQLRASVFVSKFTVLM